ncbi:hypothetical protein Tco_0575123, partial [Tanacetum coccineum]
YVVPTGRVVVPTSRYVVPAGKVIFIVSPGRLNLVPTGRILSPGKVGFRVGSEIATPTMDVHKSTTTPDVVPVFQKQEQYLNNEQTPHEKNNLPTQTSEPVRKELNKPARVRKSAIPDDYIVYLQEADFGIGIDNDRVSFSQAIKGDKSKMWIDAMKEELKSMAQNKVWNLINMPEGSKRVGCK